MEESFCLIKAAGLMQSDGICCPTGHYLEAVSTLVRIAHTFFRIINALIHLTAGKE